MTQYPGELPNQLEKPEMTHPAHQTDIVRRIDTAEDFKPKQSRGMSEVPLPEVRGFNRSGVISDQEAKDYLGETSPPEHIKPESLNSIEYVDMYVPHKDGTVLGATEYNPFTDTSRIEIYRQEAGGSFDRAKMQRTIAHEVGHSVYFDLGFPAETPRQQAWQELSAKSSPDGYVSEYAKTAVDEDFCESYATYIHDPERLAEVSPDKYNFMRDHIFRGRQYQWSRD